jgi:tetratricopeptide (TPR) repeat protein
MNASSAVRIFVTASLFSALAGSAWAQTSSNRSTQAKEHYRVGTQLFDLGKYVEAAKEYEESFRLSDSAELLYNIGQAYRMAGRRTEALAAYRGFLRRAPTSESRADAERHVEELMRAEKEGAKVDETTPVRETSVAKPTTAQPQLTGALVVATSAAKPAKRSRAWIWGVVAGAIVVAGVGVGLGVGLGTRSQDPVASYGAGGLR